MTFTVDMIKNIFPEYKVNDASNRTNNEILKIATICEKIPGIIVFFRRTPTNQSYFTTVEVIEHMQLKSINAIFINGDNNYYYMGSNENGFLHHIKRRIEKDDDCPICLEKECDNVYFYCSECGNKCCLECFMKIDTKICPMCRGDKFTLFNKY